MTTRSRGRPAMGKGLAREEILDAALAMLDEGGWKVLTIRGLATRLSVTPMSLYRHVGDYVSLLRALSDRVYAEVLEGAIGQPDHMAEVVALLVGYHQAVGRHPQLTLAIFETPNAFVGVTRQITDRLRTLLIAIGAEPSLWCDLLIDHAHGSGLALASLRSDSAQTALALNNYQKALNQLLAAMKNS